MTNKLAQPKPAQSLQQKWFQATKEAADGITKPLAIKDFKATWGAQFKAEELEALVVPRRTLARRKAQSGKLSPDETDRAMRLARIASEAGKVFGNAEKASRWLRNPQAKLASRSPLSLLESEAGTAVVLNLLGQIEHGMFA
jgi:putative toxin-antitoxin system antitoxin component (TIGR02293 family)